MSKKSFCVLRMRNELFHFDQLYLITHVSVVQGQEKCHFSQF